MSSVTAVSFASSPILLASAQLGSGDPGQTKQATGSEVPSIWRSQLSHMETGSLPSVGTLDKDSVASPPNQQNIWLTALSILGTAGAAFLVLDLLRSFLLGGRNLNQAKGFDFQKFTRVLLDPQKDITEKWKHTKEMFREVVGESPPGDHTFESPSALSFEGSYHYNAKPKVWEVDYNEFKTKLVDLVNNGEITLGEAKEISDRVFAALPECQQNISSDLMKFCITLFYCPDSPKIELILVRANDDLAEPIDWKISEQNAVAGKAESILRKRLKHDTKDSSPCIYNVPMMAHEILSQSALGYRMFLHHMVINRENTLTFNPNKTTHREEVKV